MKHLILLLIMLATYSTAMGKDTERNFFLISFDRTIEIYNPTYYWICLEEGTELKFYPVHTLKETLNTYWPQLIKYWHEEEKGAEFDTDFSKKMNEFALYDTDLMFGPDTCGMYGTGLDEYIALKQNLLPHRKLLQIISLSWTSRYMKSYMVKVFACPFSGKFSYNGKFFRIYDIRYDNRQIPEILCAYDFTPFEFVYRRHYFTYEPILSEILTQEF